MKYCFYLFILSLLSTCNSLEVDSSFSEELTVEGYIEAGKNAKVYLTVSLPFFGVVDSLQIVKAMESKAKVELISKDISEILTVKRDDSRFPFLYYRSNLIKGEVGKDYQIKISLKGKEYSSKTSVPEKVVIISAESLFVQDEKRIKLFIKNDMLHNKYFKVLIKKEDELKFSPAEPYLLDNESIKSEELRTVIKYNKQIEEEDEEVNQLDDGGVFIIKLVAITQDEYLFIKSIKGDSRVIYSIPSFSEEIYTNIIGGAFGFWTGENSTQTKITIQ